MAVIFETSAQHQLEGAKYELIRETVNFLATDQAVSQDTDFRISCETLDYDCFTQQLSSKKPIAGIDRWYNTWRAMTVTDEAELIALRNQVFADILERPGKGYRKQLAGYAEYFASTERLTDISENIAVPASIADTVMVEQASTTPQRDQDDNPKEDHTMIAYLALAIGIIALFITIRPLLKTKELQVPADPEDLEDLQTRLNGLAMRMKRLEDKLTDAQLADALTNLTQIMESIEKRVVELEK